MNADVIQKVDNKIRYFSKSEIEGVSIPERFTFPFYYEPHPLTRIAAAQLQAYLESQTDLEHNFGLDNFKNGLVIGKMFGVLVVEDAEGKLGYLSAFSGKLAGANDHPMFVPPVFDMLVEDSFFLKEQYILNKINDEVKAIEADSAYISLRQEYEDAYQKSAEEIAALKAELKVNKQSRKKLRQEQKAILSEKDYAVYEAYLIKHSLHDKHRFNVLSDAWQQRLFNIKLQLAKYEDTVESLKNERKEKSATLQQQLFEQYYFLNKEGERKSLHSIFSETVFGKPPAAAGECATPKLLQYAFIKGYKPLAMAEFWWGAPPKSEIRMHKQFYPACTGKCKPILEHMLQGMAIDENPLLKNGGDGKQLEIIYEDESFVVVNKPAELLSVPGIDIQDSVYARLKTLPGVDPLIIHRLDMSTSGLLVVAKDKDAHKHIQRQFLKRTVIKRYTALLCKVVEGESGEISLPLRGDLDDRPRQLVCFDYGKKAITRWKVVERNETTTKVHFWPLTGRTHQLRMHAAHQLGLNAPIVGDDLYGTPAERLHLHAAYLEFVHPVTGDAVVFEAAEEF
jgi:tRNA pseudouridine32 synthase/23S rRNA pseudouridine746 synthase